MKTCTGVRHLFSFLVLAGLLVSGCGPSGDPDCSRPDVFCVGLVTQLGKVTDQGFNQEAWEALEKAHTDLGARVAYIETVNTRDYDKNIATFAEAGYDLIVTIGYGQSKATVDAAVRYPTTGFIGVDQFQIVEGRLPANLATLSFPEDQAGFLAGALAAQITETNKVAAICGPDWYPPAWRYAGGFKAGVAYINPVVGATVAFHNDVGPNDPIFDPTWDEKTANSLIDGGFDIIFGADGGSTNGAVTAAAERNMLAIGVETDQFLTLGAERKLLVSSAIKLISPAVYDLIEAAQRGSMPTGNVRGQVGYAPYHLLLGKVPAKVRARMKEIQIALAEGSLKTGVPVSKP